MALAAPAAWDRSPPLAPAVAAAAKTKQLLLLKVGTRWCPSCRKLDGVLAEPAVRAKLEPFVRLGYDAEEGEGRDVAQRYNVIAFPTLLVLDGGGREVGRVTGDLAAAPLLAALGKLRDGSETLTRLEAQAKQRPADLALQLRLGTEWAFRGARTQANTHLDRVIEGDPQNAQGLAAEALLVKGKYLLLRSLKDDAGAAEVLRSLRARFPRAKQAAQAAFPLAQALHHLGKSAEALRLLEEKARSADEHDTVAWFCLRERTALARGLAHAKQAVALAPKDADMHATLAELAKALGRTAEAEAAWTAARRLDPKSPRLQRAHP